MIKVHYMERLPKSMGSGFQRTACGIVGSWATNGVGEFETPEGSRLDASHVFDEVTCKNCARRLPGHKY